MENTRPATITVLSNSSHIVVRCNGNWTINFLKKAALELEILQPSAPLTLDISDVNQLDSGGVALLYMNTKKFEKAGYKTEIIGGKEDHLKLYHLLSSSLAREEPIFRSAYSWLHILGEKSFSSLLGMNRFLHYLGEAFVILFSILIHPWRIRYRAIIAHIFTTGLEALPIIAISAFLIGVVVAYQSIVQLQKFGADIFIVDTIGISLTRELAPLISAIVVAGRSGSAFTAQLGAMKMTQEIDAMKTMGFDPFIFLVWPRVFALMLVMPLLIFFADIIGIFGGMIIAQAQSHISFSEFTHRLQGTLAIKHFIIGILKGPFFAFLIAIVSTYRGFQVSLNTESIGFYTTKSVVNSIFLVIACDAIFSILLTELKL
ncbi:MAG: ABC transporter permease [Sulfuricurvum sp.]|nr:ABC transporter permease [Sulfuricurvum sp.]